MRFRLFGVNVEIQMSFWITSILFGLFLHGANADVARGTAVVTWTLVVFVSVLVHELGHALAVMACGVAPEITLYALGGLTRFRPVLPLRRIQHVTISLAGPFAGFALGGIVVGLLHAFPGYAARLPPVADLAARDLRWVNFGWGIINLVPVLPLDGGHVLEHALGPKRAQLTSGISTLAGFLLAALFVYLRMPWGAVVFGLAAVQSYRRFTEAGSAEALPEVTPPNLAAALRSARRALEEEDLERAASLAQRVLEDGAPRSARREALEVIAWTHLLSDRGETAADVLEEARRFGEPDAGLEGAVLLARRDLTRARAVLEAARAKGDGRKAVIGPLVQVLIAQGEVGRAAELALSIIDVLSEDDARKMADLASRHGVFAPAARLYDAIFQRLRLPDDAYEAARAEARSGRPDRALDMLRRAVAAGFRDRARVLSDAALAALPTLDAVLPATLVGETPCPPVRPVP
jgi:Zn-dependent protease